MSFLRLASVLAFLCIPPLAFSQSVTSTSLSISAGGSVVTTSREGTAITLTATVTLAGGTVAMPPGQVNFCEVKSPPLRCTDIRLLGTAQLGTAGKAAYKFFPGPGTHTYQAVFLGTHIEAASSSTGATLVVTPYYPTITALTSSGTPGNYTLTATVTTTGGTVPPTGSVTFADTSNGNYVLATTSALVPGLAIQGLSFGYSSPQFSSVYPVAVVADFNGDGAPDMAVVANPAPTDPTEQNTMNVLLGNGDGSFTPKPAFQIGQSGTEVLNLLVGDFNGDGKLDIAMGLQFSFASSQQDYSGVQIMLGNGDGTFTAGQVIPFLGIDGTSLGAMGDFNGDGIPDLAVGTSTSGCLHCISILLGNGDGTFTLKSSTPVTYTGGIAVGDLNGDGKSDLVLGDQGSGLVTVLLGNGDGTFTTLPVTPATGAISALIALADFNGDGILDLVVASNQIGLPPFTVDLLLGNGDGTFGPPATISSSITQVQSGLAVGDFNGDGKADLAFGNFHAVGGTAVPGDDVSILLGNGDGTFAPQSQYPSSNYYSVVPAADLNGDGLSDVVVRSSDGQVAVLLSNLGLQSATATATVSGLSIVGTGTHQIDASYLGDINYQPSGSAPIGLTAEPVPTTLNLTASPASINYSQQVTLTATLTPSTAQQNHLPTGTVTFSSGSTAIGMGTIANGVATFNTTSLPVGTDNLTAAYSGDTNFAASTSSAAIETVGELASSTTLTVSPNPASPGQAVTLSVAVAGTGFGSSTTPGGGITFYDGATVLGAGTLDATGHATYTTSTLALGTHTLTAVYTGSTVFAGSTSNAVSEIVVKPDFAIALSSPAISLQTYKNTTTTVTLTSIGTFSDSLALTCVNPPAYVTCIFTPSPAALSGSGTAAVSFYIDTDSIIGGDGLNGPLRASRGQPPSSVGLALLLLPFGGLAALAGGRRRVWLLVIAVLELPAMLALGGCGGNVISPVPSAAPGIYVIPVTATGAATGLTHTAQLTLTVSP